MNNINWFFRWRDTLAVSGGPHFRCLTSQLKCPWIILLYLQWKWLEVFRCMQATNDSFVIEHSDMWRDYGAGVERHRHNYINGVAPATAGRPQSISRQMLPRSRATELRILGDITRPHPSSRREGFIFRSHMLKEQRTQWSHFKRARCCQVLIYKTLTLMDLVDSVE